MALPTALPARNVDFTVSIVEHSSKSAESQIETVTTALLLSSTSTVAEALIWEPFLQAVAGR
jgi:hypothetical protein